MFSNLKRSFLLLGFVCWVLALLDTLARVQGIEYVFKPESETLAVPCDDQYKDTFEKTFDFSEMNFKFYRDSMEISGALKFLWINQPGDNVEVSIEIFQQRGSTFVPTGLKIQERDGCGKSFVPGKVWYDDFMSNIIPEDQKCIAEYDEVVWHFNPFNFSMHFDLQSPNMEGTYKIKMIAKSYDKNNKYNNNVACGTLLGELYTE